MLKIKFQYFGHLMGRTDTGKDLDARKDWRQEEKRTIQDEMVGWHHRLNRHEFEQIPENGEEGGDRGWDTWMASLTPWTWVWVGFGSWWWTGRLGVLQLVHGVAKSPTWLNNWTDPLRDTLIVQVTYINYLVSMKYFRDEKTEIQWSQASSPKSHKSLSTESW